MVHGVLVAHPTLLVRATSERILPGGVTLRVGLASESQWLQLVLVLTVHWWFTPVCVGGLLVYKNGAICLVWKWCWRYVSIDIQMFKVCMALVIVGTSTSKWWILDRWTVPTTIGSSNSHVWITKIFMSSFGIGVEMWTLKGHMLSWYHMQNLF